MNNKHPFINLFWNIWHYAGSRKKHLILANSMFVASQFIIMLQPYLMGKFITVFQDPQNIVLHNAFIILILYCSTDLVFWFFHGPARCIERLTSFIIQKNFVADMHQKVNQLPLKWHKENHSGKTIDKINKAKEDLYNFSSGLFEYVETIVQYLISTVAVIYITGWYGILTLSLSLSTFFFINTFDTILVTTQKEINKRQHYVGAGIFDYISNITTIITLRLQKLTEHELIKRIDHVIPIYLKNRTFNELKWFVVTMIISITNALTIAVYLYNQYHTSEGIILGTLVMLIEYFRRYTSVFFGFTWKYENLVLTSTNVQTVSSILQAHKKLSKSTKINPIQNWKEIHITNLNFSYEDTNHKIHTLQNIHIHLEKSKKIALIGESGSGKSTLMSLIRGLDTPKEVQITVDNTPHKTLQCIQETTTLIPQEPEIFENTLAYNITLGIPHTQKEIEHVSKLARFYKTAESLPKKFNTNIREKGVNLSGGEKQRLALARGIFAAEKSSIILLDEPTSSVDSINERKIYENLFSRFENKCIISSIHRLHLLPMFDEIYVLENGKIAEKGTFEQLTNTPNSLLKTLWEKYQKHNNKY